MNVQRSSHAFILVTIIIAALYLGKNLLIPFLLAIFIWFIIREIRQILRRVALFRKFLPNWAENIIASIFLFAVIGLIITIVTANVQLLGSKIPFYEKNVTVIMLEVERIFNINLMEKMQALGTNLNLSKLISSIVNTLSSVLGNIFILVIYVMFILIEESGFQKKFRAMYPNTQNRKNTLKVLQKIDHSIGRYLLLKTAVSLLTGVLSFIVLLIFRIDAPFFWAFLIFILNYIPTIGSLIATLFPALFALLQFGDWGPALWILFTVGTIQMIVGNFVEPKVMGNSLNISSLVVILALSFWGAIWGVTGMLLSVPITVIMVILFSEIPATRNIAILLSENGNLKS
jgi:AI-2 transport protein TqsA